MPGLEDAPHRSYAETVDQQVTTEQEALAFADQQAAGLKIRQPALLDKLSGQHTRLNPSRVFRQPKANLLQDGFREYARLFQG